MADCSDKNQGECFSIFDPSHCAVKTTAMDTKFMDLQFNKNEDENLMLLSDVRIRAEKIRLGGGKKNIEKQHEKGKLTARERVSYLLDKNSPRFEVGEFAGYEMYEAEGGCPGGGVVVMIGYASGKQCVVVANDATVKAGAWFPI